MARPGGPWRPLLDGNPDHDRDRGPAEALDAAALDSVTFEERITQLCNIEGIEQLRVAVLVYAADTLVPYAMADTRLADQVLTAPGGAFRSRRQWFAIAFTCTVAADLGHVQAFSFSVGAPIPRELWEAHFLTEADADE